MKQQRSVLDRIRADYAPRLPAILAAAAEGAVFDDGAPCDVSGDAEALRAAFPRTHGRALLKLGSAPSTAAPRRRCRAVGVVLSGGQAPGGHNVIAGLFDGLQPSGSRLLGFQGGPRGVLEGRFEELTAERIAPYRNSGGFDMIRSGRDKIESPEQIAACLATCERLELDGLVIAGGDDSNTNAAVLAESFAEAGSQVAVVGVPKTIDGDLKGEQVELSFGFDTATKVYSSLIGNICCDAKSAAKYWHFIKLMGRSASHVTLECALRTQPNIALIGEEVRQEGWTLDQLVERVALAIRRRAAAGRSYGVCLVPEGLIEFIPEMGRLIDALNQALAACDSADAAVDSLESADRAVFDSLPQSIRQQLLEDRDSHGNVQVSRIETEQLLLVKVAERIERWRKEDAFEGKFGVQGHFFGYEGRCAAPSNFDANYTYSLGRLAALLARAGKSGYMCALGNLAAPVERWTAAAVPLTSMMRLETRKGKQLPVISKALVELEQPPFLRFAAERARWELEDAYLYPGAVQYFGPEEIVDTAPATLLLERGS